MKRHHSRGRDVNGILLLDKAIGLTSNAALQEVKRLYRARKAGHTGSLDPLASGMLPLCLGEATKISGFLLDADKRYWAEFHLGVTTNTGDSHGEVLKTLPVGTLDPDEVRAAFARYTGQIEQTPPMHSAIKVQGRPLYTLAHQGITIERAPRTVNVYDFSLLSISGDRCTVRIHCSKGTYIRTLAEDVGAVLGVGAHVSALRRLAVGPFTNPESTVTMERLRAAGEEGDAVLESLLLPMDSALGQWPAVTLTNDSAFYMRQGQPVLVPRAPTSGLVRLYARGKTPGGVGEGEVSPFIGVGEVMEDGRIAPRRLIASP
ncbi:tRNA pseudouridine(55) synthase [Gammaproteobacteria bacterium]